MNADEIVNALRENAEWCDANEYDVPLCMGDNQRAAADLIESLQAQLAVSQHREQAAVEDMKIIADTYREKNCDDGICGLCKFDADHGLDGYANECPGFETDDCFEWRGPQAGKGETE